MQTARILGVALFVAGVDCSGSGSGPAVSTSSLDCAWLASDNCLKANLVAGMSCVASPAETGVLSADNASCSYASGVVVTFDSPLSLPIAANPPAGWQFTVTRAGAECLRFESTDNDNFKLVVNGAAVTQTLPRPASTNVTITCPDGTSYSNSNAISLLSCDPGGPLSEGYSSDATSVSLMLQLFRNNAPPLSMFDCAR